MSLQARLKQDTPLYNAKRDVAHNFGYVAMEVAGRCEDGKWPSLVAYLKEHGVTQEQLGLACQAFCQFVVSSAEVPHESMTETLRRSGWWDMPVPAQIAIMAHLGTVLTGIYWHGVREATLGEDSPTANFQDLIVHGRRAARLMTWPKWFRWIPKLADKLRKIRDALRRK